MLENFQSHVRSRVRLAGDGQLTVILGPSDSGKTAVIRALRWLWFNDAPGDFVRVGAEFARVSLKLENGDLVIRERGKSYNRYITVLGGQRQTYEGFGTGVPLEVRQALGVWPVQFGDVEIQPTLSEQLDAPFLGKSVSAPAKARVLGKLAGTEEVDMAMRGTAADALKASQAAGQAEDEVRKLDAQIAGYGYLDALEQRVASGEMLLSQAETAQVKRERLRVSRDQLAGISCGIAAAEQVVTQFETLPAAILLLDTAAGKADYRRILWNMAANLQQVSDAAAAAERKLDRLANADEASQTVAHLEGLVAKRNALVRHQQTLAGIRQLESMNHQTMNRTAGAGKAVEHLSMVPDLLARRTALLNTAGTLNGLHSAINRTGASIELLRKAAAEAANQYVAELTAAGRCPVCGSEVHPECVKEAV